MALLELRHETGITQRPPGPLVPAQRLELALAQGVSRNADQSPTASSSGAIVTRPSSWPARCALALLQGHVSGRSTRCAWTGLSST